MPTAPPTHRPYPKAAKAADRKAVDAKRGSARKRGYTAEWDAAAKSHLRANPLCRYCALHRRVTAATAVDHLFPHRGDHWLFWKREWWVSTCKPCHDGFKQSIERQGARALAALARRLNLPGIEQEQQHDTDSG